MWSKSGDIVRCYNEIVTNERLMLFRRYFSDHINVIQYQLLQVYLLHKKPYLEYSDLCNNTFMMYGASSYTFDDTKYFQSGKSTSPYIVICVYKYTMPPNNSLL